jgi:hypothetical protein
LDEWTKFSLFYAGNTSLLSSSDTTDWHEVVTNNFEINFDEDLEFHGTKEKKIEEARLQRVEFHMIEPVLADFKFLDQVEVYLIVGGSDPVLIASDEKLFVKSTSSKIFIPIVDEIDMEDHLLKENMQFVLRYTLKRESTEAHHIKINIKVRVDSRRFGV